MPLIYSLVCANVIIGYHPTWRWRYDYTSTQHTYLSIRDMLLIFFFLIEFVCCSAVEARQQNASRYRVSKPQASINTINLLWPSCVRMQKPSENGYTLNVIKTRATQKPCGVCTVHAMYRKQPSPWGELDWSNFSSHHSIPIERVYANRIWF